MQAYRCGPLRGEGIVSWGRIRTVAAGDRVGTALARGKLILLGSVRGQPPAGV